MKESVSTLGVQPSETRVSERAFTACVPSPRITTALDNGTARSGDQASLNYTGANHAQVLVPCDRCCNTGHEVFASLTDFEKLAHKQHVPVCWQTLIFASI